LSSTLHTDFGGAVLRRVRTAPNHGDVEISNLTLVMDTGVGIPGVSDNPVVALQTSRNKGKTWGPSGGGISDGKAPVPDARALESARE
jgi:hypothetical protein